MEDTSPLANASDARREYVAERRWRIAVFLLSLAGCAAPLGFTSAAETAQLLISYVSFVLGQILQVIIMFIGKLIILLVSAVISVAQYNHFVDSAPVTAGWPLVRDVTNMFVIVILLAIAFGTIIGYQKLHYKGVLGKLLLMAILINFSKQLIGLLIDFSQVVMLTFVNAFSAAAGGNFTQALKIDRMLQIQAESIAPGSSTDPSSVGTPLLLQVIIAEMLAVFFLGITAVLLLIMFIYLVARIVGLWIALIISPLALFLTAVPPAIAGKVNSLADGYWNKLSSLIAGGPIMAFFIWLTLATVQSGGFGTFGVGTGATAGEVSTAVQAGGFMNVIGNVEDIATFFIAVIMLLMGVDAAVSMSGSLGPAVAGAARRVQRSGTAAAKFAAYGIPALAGVGAAKLGGATAGAVERRLPFDLKGGIGRKLQTAGLALGVPVLAGMGAELAATRIKERKAREKVITSALVGLKPEDRLSQLERIANRPRLDPAGARAAQLAIARNAVTPEGGKVVSDRFKAEGEKKLNLTGENLTAYTESKKDEYVRDRLSELETVAKAEGDTDALKFIKEAREKNIALSEVDPKKDLTEVIRGVAEKTPENKITETFSAASFSDPRVVDGILQGTDILDANGGFNKESVWYKKLVHPNGMAAKAIEARLDTITAAAGGGAAAAALLNSTNANERLTEKGIKGGRIVRTASGRYAYIPESAYTGQRASAESRAPRMEQEINAARALMADRRAEIAAAHEANPGNPQAAPILAAEGDLRRVRLQALRAGANMNEAYAVEQNGVFTNDAARREFIEDIQTANQTDLPNAYQVIDGRSMTQNMHLSTDSRATFVNNVDVERLGRAAHAVEATKSPQRGAMLRNIGNLAQAVDTEGVLAERKLEGALKLSEAGKGKKKLAKVMEHGALNDAILQAARGHAAAADDPGRVAAVGKLKEALRGARLREDAISMSEAKAILKREQLRTNADLANFKKYATSKTAEAVKRVTRGVASSVGEAATAAGATAAATATGAARAVRETVTPSGRSERAMRNAEWTVRNAPPIQPPPNTPPNPPQGGGGQNP